MTKKLTKNMVLTIVFQIFILTSFIISNAAEEITIKITSPQDNALITENKFTITGIATGVSKVQINGKDVSVNVEDKTFKGPILVAPGYAKKNNIVDDDTHIIMSYPGPTTIKVKAEGKSEEIKVYCYQMFVKSAYEGLTYYISLHWYWQNWNNNTLVQCPFSDWPLAKLDQGRRMMCKPYHESWWYYEDFSSDFTDIWECRNGYSYRNITKMIIHTLPAIDGQVQPMGIVFKNCIFGNPDYYGQMNFDISKYKVNGQPLKMLYGEWNSYLPNLIPNACYIVLDKYQPDTDMEIVVTEMPTYDFGEYVFKWFVFMEIDLLRDYKIEIDPGHGKGPKTGYYHGAGPSVYGDYEDDLVLDMGLKLRSKLIEGDYVTEMTRATIYDLSDNTKVSLRARVDKANKRKPVPADIFVSFHCNSSTNSSAHGTETFFYSEPTARGGQSGWLAWYINFHLVMTGLKDRGTKHANFYVIKYTEVPAVLVETAFISNYELQSAQTITDAARLHYPVFRDPLVEAIYRGIGEYFSSK